MTTDKDREAFEAWASKQQGMNFPDAFAAWNAACAIKNAQIAKLTAPPSEWEIEAVMRVLADCNSLDPRARAKAAITKFQEMRR